ncbi:helix-turn-helix domain-containing protein [Leptolyngbya sp. AN03gr2]|uniref:helix-turn-helix domain-containing protein n=1 Tax=unclassified Leptolyngbya TaxID=2650499 RepID=UPI003D316B8D
MPTPKASVIVLSAMQQQVLEQIVRQTTNPYRLVRRAQLVLSAARGCTNSEIAQQLNLDRGQVRQWRSRWLDAQAQMLKVEAEAEAEAALRTLIVGVFEDEARPGTPAQFALEQVVQIVALACEDPQSSGRPISEWTVRELADEAVRRGIVEQISPRSVGRFLKRGTTATAPESLLAERSTRRRSRV